MRCFLEKFTQLAQILYNRRLWQLFTLSLVQSSGLESLTRKEAGPSWQVSQTSIASSKGIGA